MNKSIVRDLEEERERQSTEEKSKQNITRDTEVKNNLTIARGEWGEGITGTTIKDTWTKSRGMEVGSARVGWRDGEKRHTTVIE